MGYGVGFVSQTIAPSPFVECGGSRAIWCHLWMILLCNRSTVLSGTLHMQMDVVRELPEFEVKLLGDYYLLLNYGSCILTLHWSTYFSSLKVSRRLLTGCYKLQTGLVKDL